jgi:release factor H-coupled RctB family protein
VHSGSRGFGGAILNRHASRFGTAGLPASSADAAEYMRLHDLACSWAKRNRLLIAHRFLATLDGTGLDEARCILDVWHNNVVLKEFEPGTLCHASADSGDPAPTCACHDAAGSVPLFLHRKGAAPSDQGPVVIPGSRGAFSYLVQPVTAGDAPARHGWSLAHGAGRKMHRSQAHSVMSGSFSAEELTETSLGSRVVCGDKKLLCARAFYARTPHAASAHILVELLASTWLGCCRFEEAPGAYKSIEDVIQALVDARLLTVLCVFCPVITYKTK